MKRISWLLLAAFSLGALAGCTGKQADDSVKQINLSLGDDAKSLDPALCYDTVSNTIMPMAMESLFEYHFLKRPLELQPLLAEAMPTVSADKKTYTIKVKKGVLWQDDAAFPNGKGRELKAADFIFAWKRMLLPELQSPGTWIFDGKVVGWDEYRRKLVENKEKRAELLMEEVEGLKALDDYTIQIKLTQAYPQLLNVLAMGFGAPVAKEVTDKYGQDGLNHRMVGTGAYRLVSYTPGSRVVLEKNPTFRGQTYPTEGDREAQETGLLASAGKALPLVERINFDIIKQDQPAWLQFMKGNLDASGIPKDNFDAAISAGQLRPELVSKGVNLRKSEEAVIWYLNFNMKDKIVGGGAKDLRKAISMAINRDEFIQKFLNGRGVKATGIVPRVIAGHVSRDEAVNGYNVEEAKKLMVKAGYPEGKGLPPLKFDLRGSSTTAKQQAEYIQKSLEVIGVKLEIIVNTFPAYLEKEKNGNLQFFLGGWNADFPDAENFLFLLYSKNVAPGPNASNYINPAFDRLYEKVAAMAPSPARNQLIKQAEDLAFNDGVWGMLFYPVVYSISHGWLKNFRPDSQIFGEIKYYDIDLEKKKEMKAKL
jgi:oligopeptide transport system substrate-binding protein